MKTLKLIPVLFSLLLLAVLSISSNIADASTATALLPDLRVSNISTPGGLKKGTCSQIRVTITNSSMAAVSGSIPVILYISQNGQQPSSYVGYLQGGIGPNDNYGKSVWFKNVNIPSTGNVTIKALVNSDYQIQESAYNNNTKVIKAKVTQFCGQSTPAVTGAKLEITVYQNGSWNNGNYAAISGAKVTVTKNGQNFIGTTGSNGKYVFAAIPKGLVQIKVEKYGYQTVIQSYMMPTYYAKKNIGM
ncbi:MAG: hypothetical protein KDC53_13480 [Saprospiraceae bacterium]|nr:hypothetical protein [Saprospiraceae bacterium]